MKPFGLVLAALMALGMGSAPVAAHAQAKAAAPAKLDAKTLDTQRVRGKKDAPAAIKNAGIPCTMTDARFLGSSKQKNAAGKEVEANVFEVACQQGLGYDLIDIPGDKAKAYDCLAVATNPAMACQLPGNADPKQGLAQFLAGGRPCTITEGNNLGSTPAGVTYYEAACKEGPGYMVKVSPPGSGTPPELIDCVNQLGTQNECKLTTKQQVVAWIGQFVPKAKRQCEVSDARAMGADPKTGAIYYELGCGAKPGFVVLADKGGAVVRTIDCANAASLAGGCQFTNEVAAKTEEANLYTQLAGKAGFPCTVTRYNPLGIDNKKRDVVELACSNRPDGAIVLFSDDPRQTEIYDCVRAGALGQTCHLSSPQTVYGKYNAALAAHGRGTCKINNAKWIGRYETSKNDLIETACADGLPGWVLEVDPKGTVVNLQTCGQARGTGIKCEMPTNLKK